MKTRFLIIIITVSVAVLGIIFSPLILEAYYLEKKHQQNDHLQDYENCNTDQCIEQFENGTCKTMLSKRCAIPESEPNTVAIFERQDGNNIDLSINPHDIVMNLKDGNAVTFDNEGSSDVKIFDNSNGLWRFDGVKPSSQRILIINSTGFYEFLVQNSLRGETGRIVALSDDTNSLPVETRAKMAQVIVGSDFGNEIGLVGVGSGGAEPGITITIDKKFQDKYDDAEKFYYERYRSMIPFDVPIMIEFGTPIIPE